MTSSSVQDGIYVFRQAHVRSTPSLRNFPNVAFETVPVFVLLTMTLSFQGRLPSASSFHTSFLQAINGLQ